MTRLNDLDTPNKGKHQMATKAATTKATPKVEETPTPITAKELATILNTDPKSLRRWLRTVTTDRANKGGRWIFNDDSVKELTTKWNERSTKGTTPELTDEA